MASPERFPLLYGPTPLHRLDRVSKDLGLDVWIKRDDLTGFAMGGNKARKLEYLAPAIISSGADWVVSAGSTQSNFVRQLGAVCRMIGVGFSAAVMDMPYEDSAGKPDFLPPVNNGNVLLDEMIGLELMRYPDGTWDDLDAGRKALVAEKEGEGKRVYDIPVGGSTVLGAYGFYMAGLEFLDQAGEKFGRIVTASSSGSTQTGLAYALAASHTKVTGIACDPEPELTHDLSDLALALDDFVGKGLRLSPADFDFRLDWVGPGYNVPSPEGLEAAEYLLDKEGIFLDPVYSAKGFAGLLGLARTGELQGSVCFWHTGGMPAVFAV